MAIQKYVPGRELTRFEEEMDRLFDRFWGAWRRPIMVLERPVLDEHLLPAIDLVEEKEHLVVKAELPGVEKEKIEVSLDDGVLVIKGEKKEETETEGEGYHFSERRFGSFYRALELPAVVDAEKASASYADGVLEIRLPKVEEAKPKEIKVTVK